MVALTDKKPSDRLLERKPFIRILGLFLFYISTCIICFCLYITFTEVGASYINGVQCRYFLPFVFPVLMLAASGFAAKLINVDREWKQQLYNGIAYSVSLIVLFINIYINCISKFS